jgi:pyridoxine 5-phosphate synthase
LVDEARSLGVRVSLLDQFRKSRRCARDRANRVELYTEPYAAAWGSASEAAVLTAFRAAAEAAQRLGLGVNAGHDLNRANLGAFLSVVPSVLEVSIGHALIADALELGMAETVRAYCRVIESARLQ